MDIETISNDLKCTVFPFLHIYNLGVDKYWGLTHVHNLKSFEFEQNSFNNLVLDEKKKKIIQALINNRGHEYKDFISDKGNNTIFLLSGHPGVGKSLTAEATAEYLKLPLYRVNVGDLGTNPEHMESMLTDIFNLTERWNAIMLIDEVDIFLEERSDYNIVHNAMVSTFMKILDYNNSIIFLTTNRLNNIDQAVRSRITLVLHYEDLNRVDKENIWSGLLSRWNIPLTKKTIKELASYQINGREIRNFIKTVMSIHKENKIEVTDTSFMECMKDIYTITNEFDKSQKSSLYA